MRNRYLARWSFHARQWCVLNIETNVVLAWYGSDRTAAEDTARSRNMAIERNFAWRT